MGLAPPSWGATGEPLSMADRIAAREAAERVYHEHRLWPESNPGPKPGFEERVPEGWVRERVEEGLLLSAALEILWARPITPDRLQAEMERMARETKDPEMLRELFAVLGNDAERVAEVLARPILARRLCRNLYLSDAKRGIEEGRKTDFEAWWAENSRAIEPALPATRNAGFEYVLPEIRGPETAGLWRGGALAGAVRARWDHTAVWTGTEMIVWGGTDGLDLLNSGGRYDPATDTWTATSVGTGCPSPRSGHTAVWTGSAMIVWGGAGTFDFGAELENSGGAYDPDQETWTPTPTGENCPPPRSDHTAVWTGSEMIVWGGTVADEFFGLTQTGGRFDPASGTWVPTPILDWYTPSARRWHTAVWTGERMVVWGGYPASVWPYRDYAGSYDPVSDEWYWKPARKKVPLGG